MDLLARLEGLVLIGAGVLLGLGFIAMAFLTFFTLSVPNVKLLWFVAAMLVTAILSLVSGLKLLGRPDTGTMAFGAVLLTVTAVATITKRMGLWSV